MKETDVCTMTENFTDIKTNKVRQNEHTLYMETIDGIKPIYFILICF